MNEINRIRKLAGLPLLNESEAEMQTISNNGVDQADATFDASQSEVNEEYSDSHIVGWIKNAIRDAHPVAMSPEELKIMVAGETGYGEHPRYDELFDKAYRTFYALDMEDDEDDSTDDFMRQGEMGMIDGDTMAGHRAFDQEREDWEDLEIDDAEDDIDYDQDVHEDIDQLILEFAEKIQEKAPPGMEDLVLKLKKEYPGEEEKAFATAWSIYNKKKKTDEAMDPWKGYTADDKKANALARAPKSTMQGSKAWTFSEMVCDTIEKHGIRDAFQYYVVKHGLPPRMFKIFAAKALYPWKFDKKDSFEQKPLPKEQHAYEGSCASSQNMSEQNGNLNSKLLGLNIEGLKDRAKENSLQGFVQFVNIDSRNNQPYVSDWFIDDETVVGYENGKEIFSLPVSEDLNNGYNDINYACGDDYFPDGADGPVVDKTGPSGARQGDNPEQKKMQISEVHTELVYSYRKFLEESAQKKR